MGRGAPRNLEVGFELEFQRVEIRTHGNGVRRSAGQASHEDFAQRIGVLERLVPTGAEIPEIYEAIASESEALSLDMRSVIPIEAEADSGAYFMRQNWEMEVEGSYHDIGRFLARVASFQRIVRPQVREIRPAQRAGAGTQPVTVYFELETFVLPLDSGSAGEDGGGE